MKSTTSTSTSVRLLVATAALAGLASLPVRAQEPPAESTQSVVKEGSWELVIGPFALHWSNEDKHSNVVLLGIEREQADGYIWGLSVFRNSFAQPSAYAYYGYRWNELFGVPALYFKLSGGIIYGYKGEYEDKVPFNHNGFGLGIIPAVGYRLTPKDAVQVGALGTAGLIFTYNRKF